jgi:hypothetical protein
MATGELVKAGDPTTDATELSRGGVMNEMVSSRAAEEVKAAIFLAKKYPRNETAAIARIMQACQRKGLAEIAEYHFPRGSGQVKGPSVHLAKALKAAWGNMDSGFIELERNPGFSKVLAYAWDLETNNRETRVFDIPHVRERKGEHGGNRLLTDPRDIYEMIANQASRRERACILSVIPRDVQDAAIERCHKTLAGSYTEPLIDRVRKMVIAFAQFSVTQEMIAKRFGHNVDVCTETEFATLRGIYTAVKDGQATVDDYFDRSADQPADASGKTKSQRTAETLKEKKTGKLIDEAPEAGRQPGDEA